VQALDAVEAARNCNAVFAPRDELPEVVLNDLKKDCRSQIDACAAVAETLTSHGRYQDAETYLKYSRQLAVSFKLPAVKIDDQIIQVQDRSEEGAIVAAEGDPKVKVLVQSIEHQIKQGRLAEARRQAEALYNGPFDMKSQANDWLTKIDELEFRKDAYEAEVCYELAVQAYLSKDFAGAASCLNGADMRLLDSRKQAHARELLASIEMRNRAKSGKSKTESEHKE
jgi:predicted Zn-dependent protease